MGARDYISLRRRNDPLSWIRQGFQEQIDEDPEFESLPDSQLDIPMNMLPAPSETLSSADGQCMTYYWRTSGVWFDLINNVESGPSHALATCVARRFGPHISSPVVRSAYLYYSSYRIEGGKITVQGMVYLSDYFQQARKAIEMEDYVDLMYASYAICLYEMTSRRFFTLEFAKHAEGFLISLEKGRKYLTYEEEVVMMSAYEMISNALDISRSRWSTNKNWREFFGALIQRLECANSRLLNTTTKGTGYANNSAWIPMSHPLFRAECLAYQLSSLFDVLVAQKDKPTEDSEKTEINIAIQNCLKGLWDTLSEPSLKDSFDDDELIELRLTGDTKILGDKYTRQLLYLFYLFSLQDLLLNEEWSEEVCAQAVDISITVCRLYPVPHISTFPSSDIRFLVNRGLVIAGVVAIEGRNMLGNYTAKKRRLISVNPALKDKLTDALTLQMEI
jgi:hypothetical protein